MDKKEAAAAAQEEDGGKSKSEAFLIVLNEAHTNARARAPRLNCST